MNALQELAALRVKVEEQAEEIRQLREAAWGPLPLLYDLGITPCESRMLAALYRSQKPVTRACLHAAVSDGYPESAPNIVNVYLGRLRRDLRGCGIEIKSVGRGVYSLTDAARDAIGKLISDNPQELLSLRRRAVAVRKAA